MMTRSQYLVRGTVIATAAALFGWWAVASSAPRYAGQPLGFWLRALNSADYRDRTRAEDALGQLGPEAVSGLRRALRLREGWLSRGYTRTLDRVLGVRSPRIPQARMREQAALLLARLGPQAVAAAPDLIVQLVDPDSGAALGAQTALRRIGPPAVPVLVEALRRSEPPVRRQVLELLGERPPFGEAVIDRLEAIIAALQDPDAGVRACAATTLGRLGSDACGSTDALVRTLGDPVPEPRLAAARSLGELGPCAASAHEELAARLNDADPRLRFEAARALWRTARDASRAVPALVAALEQPPVHWQAALALSEIGPTAAPAIPALLSKLEGEIAHRPARTPPSAALALAKLGPRAVPGLAALLEHRQPGVRVAAALALGGHGPEASPALPGLLTLLNEPDNETRIVAANTLGAIGPSAGCATPILHRLANEGDEYVRAAAVAALDRISQPRPPAGPASPGDRAHRPQATP